MLILLGFAAAAHAHGISEADKQAIIEGGNFRYLWLGAIHMVTGYDHLLFLFGVIFYLTGLKDILKFITAFTLGHSITLVLATFLEITADYFLVDAVIDLTICYKAFDNLDGFRKYLKINPPHLLYMIFAFGLIHGFGLSTRLQQMPLPRQGLLGRILSFNAGVELGQIAALSVLVAVLAGWRRTESFRKLGGFANALLLAAGLGLFAYQLSGYFRGDGHHHEESKGHTHDEAVLPPGGDEHPHGIKAYGHPVESDKKDSTGSYLENRRPAPVREHSHEEEHSHGNGAPHKH